MLSFGPRALLSASLAFASLAFGQAPSTETVPTAPGMPRDYRGVQIHISGIFVTPVPNAPFSANVQIVSHQKLADGSEHVLKTRARIARTTSGRIYNERRHLVSPEFTGEPQLLGAHTFDPTTRLSVFLDPGTRLARETTLPALPPTPANALPPNSLPLQPGTAETSLGGRVLNGVALVGFERTRVVPASRSGTDKPLIITDEYWYAPSLSIYCVIRHNDPRYGEQLIAVTDIVPGEPSAELFRIPDTYKVVDETPPPPLPAPAR